MLLSAITLILGSISFIIFTILVLEASLNWLSEKSYINSNELLLLKSLNKFIIASLLSVKNRL